VPFVWKTRPEQHPGTVIKQTLTFVSPWSSSSRLILVDARGRARVIGADGSGASVRPDGSGASVRPDGSGASVRPDGSGSSVRPDGSSGAAPVETEGLKTASEVVHALWPELEPVMRLYYATEPKVAEHLASGTKEVEAMKEWLFSMTAASRCFSLPTGWADEMYIAFFGTYNLGA
jgi:hypothetical protein